MAEVDRSVAHPVQIFLSGFQPIGIHSWLVRLHSAMDRFQESFAERGDLEGRNWIGMTQNRLANSARMNSNCAIQRSRRADILI